MGELYLLVLGPAIVANDLDANPLQRHKQVIISTHITKISYMRYFWLVLVIIM